MKKKTIIFASLIIGIILAVLGSTGIVSINNITEAMQDFDIGTFVENEVAPAIVLALTSISTIYLFVQPILKKLGSAASGFLTATSGIKNTEQNGINSIAEMKAFTKTVCEALASLQEQINASKATNDTRMGVIEHSVQNMEQICRIAFGNMDELVKKGYAAEIYKVGEANEETEV